MSEGKEEVVIELEEERKTREDKYKEWKKGLSSSQRKRITHAKMNIGWRSFPIVALRLQYLKEREDTQKVSVIGKALRKHFEKLFKLPAPPIYEEELETVGDRLNKVIKNTEKLLNVYEKHTGRKFIFTEALGHKWQESIGNWKKYHDLITSAIKELETGVVPTLELHEISNLNLFKIISSFGLLYRIKNVENEVSSKADLEKLKNLASDITGAIGFVTKIEKLIKKYRKILEMEILEMEKW